MTENVEEKRGDIPYLACVQINTNHLVGLCPCQKCATPLVQVGVANEVICCEGELAKLGSIPMIKSMIQSRQNEIGYFTLLAG